MDDYWHQMTCAHAIEVMQMHLFTHRLDEPVIYLVPLVQVTWQISDVLVSEPHKSRLRSYLHTRLDLQCINYTLSLLNTLLLILF
jgi:hypothetical protein